MPIDSKHPEYINNQDIWQKCLDFYDGEEAVKKAGSKYVPRLNGQNSNKYFNYINRGPFFGSVSRTVSALTGAVFKKPPAVNIPKSVEYLLKDATGTGMSLNELAIALSVEIMKTGRAGLLVDVAEEGGKPYLSLYTAQNVINWNEGKNDTFIVLQENTYVRNPKDRYDLTMETIYRELKLNEDGLYEVVIWKKNGPYGKFEPASPIYPKSRKKNMTKIPFCIVSPIGLDFSVDRPPILDMVNTLAAWWRVSVDHANAIHTICVPTPYVSGNIEAEEFELTLGPDSCIVLPDGSKLGFLEFAAGGLSEVSSQLDRLMEMQAALGARLISDTGKKTMIETAEGARIRESMSTAVLGSIVASVEAALMKAVDWAAEWVEINPAPSDIKLNKELISPTIDANMVNSLLNAVLKDNLSFESFYRALEEAGMTDPGVTSEDEKKRIEEMIEKKRKRAEEYVNSTNDTEKDVIEEPPLDK